MWSGSGHAVPLRSLRKLKTSKIHQKTSKIHRKEFEPEEEDRQNQRACSENHKKSKEKQKASQEQTRKIDKEIPRSVSGGTPALRNWARLLRLWTVTLNTNLAVRPVISLCTACVCFGPQKHLLE